MKPETVLLIRRLAREAVIFALVGQLLVTVFVFFGGIIHRDLISSTLESLFLGLRGFQAGLALWIFYRLVRFAVKG